MLVENKAESEVRKVLAQAGIEVDGENPWDIRVHNKKFYRRMALCGSLGLGEAYMAGWWDCDSLDMFFARLVQSPAVQRNNNTIPSRAVEVVAKFTNRQNKRRAFQVGEEHYDLGNDLYQAMLDQRMVYTCAYWKGVDNLDAAQEAKLDLACRKLHLEPGMRVLDIGCGWGSFCKFAAENYGVNVVGVTISKEQAELARIRCKGLPVEIRLQDYRDCCDGEYDRVVSLGMMEHVGAKNYRTYLATAHKNVKSGGLFLIQVIGTRASMLATDPWLNKYVFPNSMLPSVSQIGAALDGLFSMEDWHSFGAYYDKTLMAWNENFEKNWSELKNQYSEKFHRMWRYYLLMSAGLFRVKQAQLWQVVLSKDLPDLYEPVR